MEAVEAVGVGTLGLDAGIGDAMLQQVAPTMASILCVGTDERRLFQGEYPQILKTISYSACLQLRLEILLQRRYDALGAR